MRMIRKLITLWEERPYIVILVILGIALAVMIRLYHLGEGTLSTEFGGPDAFGQFGDYVGGLLNPIFGFLTVCLLIAAGRDTKHQVQLSKQEYNRKQLEDAVQRASAMHEIILGTTLSAGLYHALLDKRYFSLREFLTIDSRFGYRSSRFLGSDWKTREFPYDERLVYQRLEESVFRIVYLTCDLLKLTHVNSLKDHWMFEAGERIDECFLVGIIDAAEMHRLRDSMVASYRPAEWF